MSEGIRLFYKIIDSFLQFKTHSEVRVRHYRVMQRALHRFEMYKQLNGNSQYKFAFQTLQLDEIYEFEDFLVNEHKFYKKYPQLYVDYPADVSKVRKSPMPKPRGTNYMANFMKRFKTIVH